MRLPGTPAPCLARPENQTRVASRTLHWPHLQLLGSQVAPVEGPLLGGERAEEHLGGGREKGDAPRVVLDGVQLLRPGTAHE